eukprot:gene4368-20591_t
MLQSSRARVACETSPSETGPSETGPSETGPSETGPIETGPSETGPSETGPSETGPSETGPSETGPSETGPSETGPSETGPSETGASETGPSETVFCKSKDDVHSSRAVSQDIFTSLFECTPVKVDAILGGIDFDELPELKQSDLQILQDIQEKEQNQNTSTGDEKQCPTSSLSKDTLESGKLESNTIRESRTEVWGSIAGSSRDSQETIISDKTRDDAEEKSFLKKEVRTNSTLNESSLQCLSPSLSFESEDSGSTKDSEDSQSQKSYKSKKKGTQNPYYIYIHLLLAS